MRFTIETENLGLKIEETAVNTEFNVIGYEHGIY